MTTFSLLKLFHTFGFVSWFVGLLGTTAAQVATRKVQGREGRLAAWSVTRRLEPFEWIGLAVTPLTGIALAVVGGMFKLGFVHAKLALVLIAVFFNLMTIAMRRKVGMQLEGEGADVSAGMKRLAMFQGIATLMLPLAVLAVYFLR
ncbi:MAG TPA: hypothetical protein VN033_09680 [Vulgatibacter sp.]|nr:hypothetical protein [Vulgatibacter sp.]